MRFVVGERHLDPELISPDGRMRLAEYTLSPRRVAGNAASPWVIIDSDRPEIVPDPASARWTLVADLRNGVRLYRTGGDSPIFASARMGPCPLMLGLPLGAQNPNRPNGRETIAHDMVFGRLDPSGVGGIRVDRLLRPRSPQRRLHVLPSRVAGDRRRNGPFFVYVFRLAVLCSAGASLPPVSSQRSRWQACRAWC